MDKNRADESRSKLIFLLIDFLLNLSLQLEMSTNDILVMVLYYSY